MSKLFWLSQITTAELSLVGNKIFLLSQFLQQNFPVVPGFALGGSSFKKFLGTIDNSQFLISNFPQSTLHLNVDNYQALQSVASKSRETILQGSFDRELQTQIFEAARQLNSSHLILRPSLISTPPQKPENTELVRSQICSCHPEAIVRGIKEVWADLFSAKSLFYWHKLGSEIQDISCGILIQPIDIAIASGTVVVQSQKATIQATWGLGHSLHRGEVAADCYAVDLKTTTIIDRNAGFKTHGYRLKNIATTANSTDTLESYIIEDGDREKIVLQSSQINYLIQLTRDMIAQDSTIVYFEWVLFPSKNREPNLNFSLTRFGYNTSAFAETIQNTQLDMASSKKVLLHGVAAAGGTVTAEAIVDSSQKSDRLIFHPGSILVTKKIQPHRIPSLKNIGGIITEVGGKTSHGAIIARELGIPAIVAANNATDTIKTGDLITLDGDRGIIYTAEISSIEDCISNDSHKRQHSIVDYYTRKPTGNVPIATQLAINASQPHLIEETASLPVDGVGLLRGEFMLLELLARRSLDKWLQPEYKEELLDYLTAAIRQFTRGFAPRPVYYRSLDFSAIERDDSNSVLGIRGTFAHMRDPTFFQLELTALSRVMAERNSNLKLILPFVRSLREWHFCRDLVVKAGLTNYPNFQLWIMAEIPSVILMLREYIAAGVAGIAIGTNDLTQLLLGIDREEASFALQGLDNNSLPVQKAIAKLIEIARENQIPCSICLSSDTTNAELIDKLVAWGITTISVEPQMVEETYKAIAKAEKRILLENINERDTP